MTDRRSLRKLLGMLDDDTERRLRPLLSHPPPEDRVLAERHYHGRHPEEPLEAPQGLTLRIVSSGHPDGTHVLDQFDRKVQNVLSITWEMEPGSLSRAIIVIAPVEVDLVAEAYLEHE